MIEFSGTGILLDIEGTTSSIDFIKDTMFPFVRKELDTYLRVNWDSEELNEALELIAKDRRSQSFAEWCGGQSDKDKLQKLVRDEVIKLMDEDAKERGLKQLQGLIWKPGFKNKEIIAHVYDDVFPALQDWQNAGCDLRTYSSGSSDAAKLFFGHTRVGDMLYFFNNHHYDTTIGLKKETESYRKIAENFHVSPNKILFVSDVPEELDAASKAGLTVALCKRPDNRNVPKEHGYPEITSFEQIEVRRMAPSPIRPNPSPTVSVSSAYSQPKTFIRTRSRA